jgi:hypothetical protein
MTKISNPAISSELRTRWGGIGDQSRLSSGFFRTERIADAWWLIDPDGGRFLSKGVNTVRFDQDRIHDHDRIPYAEACQRKYGSKETWRGAAAQRLLSCGFNSLGAWSDDAVAKAGPAPLALAPIIDIGVSFLLRPESDGEAAHIFPDVFEPSFKSFARRHAIKCCAAQRNDPSILGWFTDNELRWGPDWRGRDELLTIFLNFPQASAGRGAAIAFLRDRYSSFDMFKRNWYVPVRSWDELATAEMIKAPYLRENLHDRNDRSRHKNMELVKFSFFADCDAFAAQVARRYLEIAVASIKTADPNHMVLGCRFAYVPQQSVIQAAGDYLDIISFNCYDLDPAHTIKAYAISGKPCLIGEFSFRSDDSGLPNTIGAAPRLPIQADRARHFQNYVVAGLSDLSLVGYHWFEHADQPAQGRFDGENSNYGIVSINDDSYLELMQMMKIVNAEAEQIHAGGTAASKIATIRIGD